MCTLVENVNWCSHDGKKYGGASKNKKYLSGLLHSV